MKKKDVRLKGQLRMYMQWPVIMTVLLAAMNIWMYMVDRKAGGMMSVMVIIYMVIVGVLYVYNRSLILADMVQFSTQYNSVCDSDGGRTDRLEERPVCRIICRQAKRKIFEQADPGVEPRRVPERGCRSCGTGSALQRP